MALTSSTMLPLGTPLPGFCLPEPLTGRQVSPDAYAETPLLLVAFICNHCPYVVHLRRALVDYANDYAEKVQVLGICSNDAEAYPQDSPEKMAEEATVHGFPFPYLFDKTQETAIAFHAACTPEFYLFGRERRLVYRGQFDETRPEHRTAPDTPTRGAAPTGADLRRATDLALEGQVLPEDEQRPGIGCNIKWKPGRQPEYA